MTDVLEIVFQFLSSEVKNKIDEYLFKIKSTKFLSELNLDLNSSYISLKSYSLKDLENLKSIWLEIAHLSVNLYAEYEFFLQFSFPSRYESQIYEESLRKLGYKQHDGIWKINEIPNKQCIIENIFYSYIYIFLFQQKQQELDNEKFIKENAENSKKFAKLCNENRKSDINNTQENIDIAITSNREMGNFSNDFRQKFGSKVIDGKIGICMNMSDFIINNPINTSRNDESLDTSINSNITVSSIATCSNLQNIFKEDQSIKTRPTSSEISNRPGIKSDNSSHWTCNNCTYNQNNNGNINCEVCMSTRFAKINSCAFESSYEASNENKDQKSEKLNENQIKLNNNGSQNIERKDVVSTEDRKRDGDFRIYNIVYKTQSEISESDNSPSKGDQNRGKLNENVEMKNKDSIVAATNKMNPKQCKNCKSKSCYNNQYWCDKCENLKWFCENEACNVINFKNEHCKQCKAKKGSNFSNCTNFCIMKDGKEVNMWQCGFCLQFIAGTLLKCDKCRNLRDLPHYKKCKCNWINLNIRGKCDKCGADLMKITTA